MDSGWHVGTPVSSCDGRDDDGTAVDIEAGAIDHPVVADDVPARTAVEDASRDSDAIGRQARLLARRLAVARATDHPGLDPIGTRRAHPQLPTVGGDGPSGPASASGPGPWADGGASVGGAGWGAEGEAVGSVPWGWTHVVDQVARAFGQVRLQDRYTVDVRPSVDGTAVHIVHETDVALPPLPDAALVEDVVLSRLELVPGVGPATRDRLVAAGIRSISDLVTPVMAAGRRGDAARGDDDDAGAGPPGVPGDRPGGHAARRRRTSAPPSEGRGTVGRHREAAQQVVDLWRSGDRTAMVAHLRRRLGGRGHLLATALAGVVPAHEVAFVDLESLGLVGNMVFLIGIGTIAPPTDPVVVRSAGVTSAPEPPVEAERANRHWDASRSVVVRQFLALTPADEPAILQAALTELASRSVLVTYNGTTADLAWLRARCAYHQVPGCDVLDRMVHLDLLFGTRRRFVRDGGPLEDARLPTVQVELLGGCRNDDVPSAAVPDLYLQAVQTGRPGILVPVLEHNRADIEALVPLLGRLAAVATEAAS
jgi:uncharacterized protein YprB with RNaseH-like and TPR domain